MQPLIRMVVCKYITTKIEQIINVRKSADDYKTGLEWS